VKQNAVGAKTPFQSYSENAAYLIRVNLGGPQWKKVSAISADALHARTVNRAWIAKSTKCCGFAVITLGSLVATWSRRTYRVGIAGLLCLSIVVRICADFRSKFGSPNAVPGSG